MLTAETEFRISEARNFGVGDEDEDEDEDEDRGAPARGVPGKRATKKMQMFRQPSGLNQCQSSRTTEKQYLIDEANFARYSVMLYRYHPCGSDVEKARGQDVGLDTWRP